MEESGLAITVGPEVKFNAVDGDHVYEVAPLAVKLTPVPEQVDEFPLTETVGKPFTINATVFVALHAPEIPEMVYVIFEIGVDKAVAPVVAFNAVDGDHVYVEAPETVKEVELPEQIVVVPLTFKTKLDETVTAIVFEFVQPFEVPVTV